MIYLIESPNYYKIGYTNDINKRLKQYKTHCLEINLVDCQEGDSKDETLLHYICSPFLVENEWFRKDSEILNIWNIYNKYLKVHLHTKSRLNWKEYSIFKEGGKHNTEIFKFEEFNTEEFSSLLNILSEELNVNLESNIPERVSNLNLGIIAFYDTEDDEDPKKIVTEVTRIVPK